MAAGQDCVALLDAQLGSLSEHFAPDKLSAIVEGLEKDELQAQSLAKMREHCRTEGGYSVLPMVERSQVTCAESCSHVVSLRRSVTDIVDGLLELQDHAVRQDPQAVRTILEEIHEAKQRALATVASNKQKMDKLNQELFKVDAEKKKEAAQADQHAKHAKAEAERLKGQARDAVIFEIAGGVAGTSGLALAAGVAAAGPVAIGVGVGLGLSVLLGAERRRQCKAEGAKKEGSKAAEALELEEDAKDAGKTVGQLMEGIRWHGNMQKGLEMSADDTADRCGKVESLMSLNGSRRKVLDKRLKELGDSLRNSISTIDKYLFFLSRTEFIPPNLNVQDIIGKEAYDGMLREVQNLQASQSSGPQGLQG